MNAANRVSIRATLPGEGPSIAALWRELWDELEPWGGYPGSRDPDVYAELARLLDDDARIRAGHPVHGRHVHLVADLGGVPCGQVQGWIERYGVHSTTAVTCEVRSLIVTERARGLGVGRTLLEALRASARILSQGLQCVLAAEVLEPNPALAFYTRLGYRPIAHCARIEAAKGAAGPGSSPGCPPARVALQRDVPAIAWLDGMLAARRRACGDVRFDPPQAGSAVAVTPHGEPRAADASGRSDAGGNLPNPAVLLSIDDQGAVRGGAFFVAQTLEPPFVALRRAFVGRFAVDPSASAASTMTSLIALACRMALIEGARYVEVADLPAPGTELYEAAMAAGAAPWSRVVATFA